MKQTKITLQPLQLEDQEKFILDNQWAFKYGAMEEFGLRNANMEEEGEIISRKTIERSIREGIAYRIMDGEKKVGGLIISIHEEKGDLEILFVDPQAHSKGIGYQAWCEVERLYPNVKVWETMTPYFETRNIHFYVNRCGFHIVEFFNSHHPDPNDYSDDEVMDEKAEDFDGMFRFEKVMK